MGVWVTALSYFDDNGTVFGMETVLRNVAQVNRAPPC